jgi:hypothetical protein
MTAKGRGLKDDIAAHAFAVENIRDDAEPHGPDLAQNLGARFVPWE